MNNYGDSAGALLRELLSSDGINELTAILVAVVVSLIVNRLMRTPLKRIRVARSGSLAEGAIIIAPFLVAMALTAFAIGITRMAGAADGILVLAFRLVVALGA
ncbi:MAG: hypothetical protein EB048_10840, partial [Gammaproteobacteria bacterium]|nr:hypothetical protein [Gammaproteobacteria bacterium]